MDIATGRWFKYLTEETSEQPTKQTLDEISRKEARDLYDWMAQEGDRINPEFDELFNGSMRVAFPLGTEEERNLAQLVSALKEQGWEPGEAVPWEGGMHSSKKFPIRSVKQKYRGEGGVEQEREMEVAKLDLHRTYKFTIPAGPRKGETIDKTRTTTMSRAVFNLKKGDLITPELADWWAKKQTYYTKEDEWTQIEDMFAGTHQAGTDTVIVSRHPMDVLRMSDIGNISSCHREHGEYFKCAVAESRGTGLLAYLVKTQKLEEFLRTGFKDAEAPPTDKVDMFLNWLLRLERPSLGAKQHTIGSYLKELVDDGVPEANITIAFKRMMRAFTTDSEKVAEKGGQPVWQYDNPLMKNMRSAQNLTQRMLEKLPELAEMPQTDDQTTYQAQLVVQSHILEDNAVRMAMHKWLNDADLFEKQLQYMKADRWRSVPPDVKDAVTPDMVREAIHAHFDKKPWPPLDQVPTPRPIGDFDNMEIFRDSNRNIPGIVANARVRLRKFFDSASGDYFAVPEERTYGRSAPGFANVVGEWAWDNQKYLFVEEGEDQLELPRESYLIRYGGSYEDTQDGFILNDFFSRSGTKVNSYRGNVEHEYEEGDNLWEQYEEQVDDLLTQAQNRSQHVSFQAEVAGDEQPYVWGRADVRFTFPLGWSGEIDTDGGYYRFPSEEREYTPIPSGYANSEWKDRRAFTDFVDDSVDLYSEDTNWEVYDNELLIDMTFNCDDCSDPDSLDSFIDYTISDLDDNYDTTYEKMRRALVEANYIAPSDFDRMFDDMREVNEELQNWRATGLDEDDDYDGEIWFWFEPRGQGYVDTPVGMFPKTLGNTPFALERIFNGGQVKEAGKVYPGPAFIKAFSEELLALQQAANGYAEEQLELDFGETYERPIFQGVQFSRSANLRFILDREGGISMILKIIIESSDSVEEVEGAFAFMRYVDGHSDVVVGAAIRVLKEFIAHAEDKVRKRDESYLDGSRMQEYVARIDSRFGAEADTGNTDAEAAVLAAIWIRDNWQYMGKPEKYTAIDKILRPLSIGSLHPRHVWDVEEDQPNQWVAMVQATMRGMELPTRIHWNYKGIEKDSREKPEAPKELTPAELERAQELKKVYMDEYFDDQPGPVRPADWTDEDWRLVVTQIPFLQAFADESYHSSNPDEEDPSHVDTEQRPRNRADMLAALSDEDRSAAMDALVAGDREEFMRIVKASEESDEEEPVRLRGRLGPPQPAQESIEAQIERIDKMLNEQEPAAQAGIDLRIYKVEMGLVVDVARSGTDSQIENQIRGIEGVTTVRHLTGLQRRLGHGLEYRVYEIKFELYGQAQRDEYRDFKLVPGITADVQGCKVRDRGQVQTVERGGLAEWGTLGINPMVPDTAPAKMVTPEVSIQGVLEDWVEGAVQIYDRPMNANDMQYHVMTPTSELWKLCSRYYRGSRLDFDGRYKHFIKNGAQMPVYVAVGQNGRVKITGGEDLVWFARKAGLDALPVFFSYQKQV